MAKAIIGLLKVFSLYLIPQMESFHTIFSNSQMTEFLLILNFAYQGDNFCHIFNNMISLNSQTNCNRTFSNKHNNFAQFSTIISTFH